MAEFNRKEDAKQCLDLAAMFKAKAEKLKHLPSRQPSKAKKRTESDKIKRAKAFEQLKAGTYVPVALRSQAAADGAPKPAQPPAKPVLPTYDDDENGSGFIQPGRMVGAD